MANNNRWLLPEGIDEVLPPQAHQLDAFCRKLIDLYSSWGYQLVKPTLIEYLDSLLTGTGGDLDLRTFKLTDQLTGKMMGVRADMTPQVARIDVHILKRTTPTRLCYLGPVLHTRPESHGETRIPLQVGAELYGHAGIESDAEILSLMLRTLNVLEIRNIHVDLGHIGIYRGLADTLDISKQQGSLLFDTLQRKAATELKEEIDDWSIPTHVADMLLYLMDLNGGIEVLDEARNKLAKAGKSVLQCIDELQKVAELYMQHSQATSLYFELAELRGYHYHAGLVFAAYIPGHGQEIARGGRYDDVGHAFGRPRPAVGFSTDIKALFNLVSRPDIGPKGIFAPVSELPGLIEQVESLRQEGNIVIYQLPGQMGGAKEMDCDRELVLEGRTWKVKRI